MLADEHRQILLSAAEQSILGGLNGHGRVEVEAGSFPAPLQQVLASFVTLEAGGALRGCIGRLSAAYPLIQDVVHNAYASAFEDHRFPALKSNQLTNLDLHLSVLSEPQALAIETESDLLAQLRPGTDGLILSDGARRGTFLPSVWEKLPEPNDFVRHLKQKAGLDPDYWSDTVQIERYTTESFGRRFRIPA